MRASGCCVMSDCTFCQLGCQNIITIISSPIVSRGFEGSMLQVLVILRPATQLVMRAGSIVKSTLVFIHIIIYMLYWLVICFLCLLNKKSICANIVVSVFHSTPPDDPCPPRRDLKASNHTGSHYSTYLARKLETPILSLSPVFLCVLFWSKRAQIAGW